MLEVKYLGHSAFYFKTKEVKIVTDPFSAEVGFQMKRVEADIVTVSHDHFDHNYIEAVKGDFLVVNGPGEYEIKGVDIKGYQTYHDHQQGKKRGLNTIYQIEADGFRLLHLGDLGQPLPEAVVEKLDQIDVVFVPVGGFYTLSLDEVIKTIEQLEPKIVVPMHYKLSDHNKATFDKLAPLSEFLQEMGVSQAEVSQTKLSLKSIDNDQTQIVVLERWS